MTSNATSTSASSDGHHTENPTTLKAGLMSLYREGILCDIELKTATETFAAHTAVLSARSPVFKRMFVTDMKEKKENHVIIDDMDADTVRRMLLFMYTDTLESMEFNGAKNVYIAADKYMIVKLKNECSNYLKRHLQRDNWYDGLLMAEQYQDKNLKTAVEDYIAENDYVVLSSNEWKHLEENQPQLTIEVFRTIYMKVRRELKETQKQRISHLKCRSVSLHEDDWGCDPYNYG